MTKKWFYALTGIFVITLLCSGAAHAQSCTPTVTWSPFSQTPPFTANYSSSGGPAYISVQLVPYPCTVTWHVTIDSSGTGWVHCTGSFCGTNNTTSGTANFTVDANTMGPRSTFITFTDTFGSATYYINEAGATYPLTVQFAGNGQGQVNFTPPNANCTNTCTKTYNYNDTVTLKATTPLPGYVFAGWSGGGCSGTGNCVVTVTTATTVTATFNASLTVNLPSHGTITSADGHIVCPPSNTCSWPSAITTPPAQTALTATPAQGYNFASWGNDCASYGSSNPCTLVMSQARVASATFTQATYTLTVSTSGSGTVTSTDGYIGCHNNQPVNGGSCSHPYLSFSPVTLHEAADSGSSFSGWTGPCNGAENFLHFHDAEEHFCDWRFRPEWSVLSVRARH